MASFRVHLSNDLGSNAVTNLITGIGQVRDESGNGSALEMLSNLEAEIAFVRRYILEQSRSIDNSIVVRADAFASEVYDNLYRKVGLSADVRSKATGSAIHP